MLLVGFILGLLPFQIVGFLAYFYGCKYQIRNYQNWAIFVPSIFFAATIASLTLYAYFTSVDSGPAYALYFGGIIFVTGTIINALCALPLSFLYERFFTTKRHQEF